MKKIIFDEQVEIKINNNREQKLYNIMRDIIERDAEYLTTNKFGDSTRRIIQKQDMVEVDGILTAMFFMDMTKEPFHVDNISFYKEHDLYKV